MTSPALAWWCAAQLLAQQAAPGAPASAPVPAPAPLPAPASAERVRFIGAASIPGDTLDRSGLEGDVVERVPHARLGSLGSGIETFDVAGNTVHLLAIDDRGPGDGAAPFQCRFHRLSLVVDPAAETPVRVALDATVLLRRGDGGRFSGLAAEQGTWADASGRRLANRMDPEAIRRLPDGNLLVSEEYVPAVLEFAPDGTFRRRWPVPEAYLCKHPGPSEADELPPANTSGRQPNKGFEGLAVTPAGVVWALPQGPLLQDGALTAKGKKAGRNLRMLRLGTAPAQEPMKQFVYRLESPAHGTCELLAIDEHRFLAIERDGSDAKFRAVFLVDASRATDVAAIAALPSGDLPAGIVPVHKELLIDLRAPESGIAAMPEKIEGLAFGPVLADGRRTLVVASDNDMKADQPTWFWVYALPASVAPAAPRAAPTAR